MITITHLGKEIIENVEKKIIETVSHLLLRFDEGFYK